MLSLTICQPILNLVKSKIIQPRGLLGALWGIGPFADPLMKFAASLAKNTLGPLAIMVSASAIHGAIQRKMSGRSCC